VNDNLFLVGEDGSRLTDYTADPDVGHFFQAWKVLNIRQAGMRNESTEMRVQSQQQAAQKTEPHVATPAESHADALGRTIYAVAHNRVEDPDHPG
jgi:hypothetical protein